ncbi:uncharacterized protein PV09_02421 [Verruconis gallopava]|uniref:Hypervirulence associated protein TUDOR domain-containing protein n=1 Tax=Verruconis gallopava TaxID=253628 RepID=A0A0D1Z194_9PEZI|nr:uncharacterized protein PV09_02421 [Verruconis gallopava]KIW06727.1 hypothetical protein PV09_02421 [Verruconis gallopava]
MLSWHGYNQLSPMSMFLLLLFLQKYEYPTEKNQKVQKISKFRALHCPTNPTSIMPLVVPGLQSKDGSKTSDWMNKLMGKKIGETNDEITFARKDLPSEHRIVKEGDMMTMDHKPDRLNIHIGDDGTVSKVTHG